MENIEEVMSYEDTVKLWKDIYKYCLGFDARIGNDPEITQEDIQEYLGQKATLMLNLLKMLIMESVENKGTYDVDYMMELLVDIEKQLETEETPMTTFDSHYMRETIEEAKEDFTNEVLKREND